MTDKTPMFPGWSRLAGRPSRSVSALAAQQRRELAGRGLSGVAALLEGLIDPALLAPAAAGSNSRRRIFDTATTFHALLWQVLDGQAACREAVQQVQMARGAGRSVLPSSATSAYCQARARLGIACISRAAEGIARRMSGRALDEERWLGREVKLLDGTGVRLDDTAESREVFGTPGGQKPGCGFPVMKLCALFSLTTGAWLAHECGALRDHDLYTAVPLLEKHLCAGDVLVADRAFSAWWLMAMAVARGADCVMRLHQARRADFRRGRRLGKDDRLLFWPRPQRSAHCPLSDTEYEALPEALEVRMVRCRAEGKGDRTRRVMLVSTLRDAARYPAAQLGALYRRRWQIELNFDDIKTTLAMNHLRVQSAEMAVRLLAMYQCSYNLIRALMQQSAHAGGESLYRLSFKATATLLSMTPAWMAPAAGRRHHADVLALLRTLIAGDPVPWRPGRHEPRTIKRRPPPYQMLTAPRHLMKPVAHHGKHPKPKTLTHGLS